MDTERREFLKLVLLGGGLFFIGKFFNPLFERFFGYLSIKEKEKKSPFTVFENRQRLSIYDNSGEEIFQIDKEA